MRAYREENFEGFPIFDSIQIQMVKIYVNIFCIIILFQFIFLKSVAQCRTVSEFEYFSIPLLFGSEINCSDSFGKKQGFWVEVDSSNMPITYQFGCYTNNKKIGEWKYYLKDPCVTMKRKTEFYYLDGSVKVDFNNSEIFYNYDSTTINAEINYYKHRFSISCFYGYCKLSSDSVLIKTFPVDEIDYVIQETELGIYVHELKKIKSQN